MALLRASRARLETTRVACMQCHNGQRTQFWRGSVKIVLQSGPIYIPGVQTTRICADAIPISGGGASKMAAR